MRNCIKGHIIKKAEKLWFTRISLCRMWGLDQQSKAECPGWAVAFVLLVGVMRGSADKSQALTWLGHRPLFAFKQAAGGRQLTNTCPVHCPGSELIEMAFLKVGDLQGWKGGLWKLRLGQRSGRHQGSGAARAGDLWGLPVWLF